MFIIVKFGDDQHVIFNPDCRNKALLDLIRKRCDCECEDTLELSDETGRVKNIHGNLMENGTTFFKDREILILLKLQGCEEGKWNSSSYVPLLNGLGSDQEFIDKLNTRSAVADDTKNGRSSSRRPQAANQPKRMTRRHSKVSMASKK